MENAGFPSSGDCGEEIERALMDLGPLLGVSIKEEINEELGDGSSNSGVNGRGAGDGGAGDGGAGAGAGGGDAAKAEGEGADSLASPTAQAAVSAARCVFCHALLAHTEGTPKLMECLHSACDQCVKAKIEEKLSTSRDFLGAGRVTVTCAECRLQCQPANMIDQRFVLEKMALEQAGGAAGGAEQQCSSCGDTEPATSYCVDCAEFICDSCVSAHQRLKITKEHTIKSRAEALSELQAAAGAARASHDMFCRDHPQERLALFCETCDRLTCRDCQLQHHRDHKYQFSTEMAAQARSSIAALLAEVSYKRVLLGSAMKVIRDRQALIADKKKALVHEITQTVVKLTNAINTRGKQLVLRLNEVCDGKQRTLAEKKEALEQLAAITDHCVRFVGAALDQGSDTAVLYSKRAVCAHLQRIKSRRADIPNPEIPVRISLALDKLPDLLRVLSSIGAIVVDGKVDGGAAGSPGPPPAAPHAAPHAPPTAHAAPHAQPYTAPHSAVAALQHVAMHQSYAAAASAASAAGGYLARGGARAITPLRHPHVTSTTHPHHLHGMNELNLRGLLNAGGRAARPPHPAHPAHAAHAYQHMMGAYASGSYGGGGVFPAGGGGGAVSGAGGGGSGRRSGGPRTPSPHHAPPQPAKWHIPQHALANGGAGEEGGGGGGEAGAEYKITLGRPRAPPPAPVVTSTNPKTPSPSLNGGAMELDKVCAESVQDLMATIAKLDSNGVQVVAETAPPPAAPAPPPPASPALVHSSTDERRPADPNEDWCAVCMDGGELMCCDRCPKVFHQYCHIPTIEKLPDESESWQCLLCVNFAALPPEPAAGGAAGGELAGRARRLVERVTLELYCQYELSLPFREPAPPHPRVARPMCLDAVRARLQPAADHRYTSPAQFVADVRLIFQNAYVANPPESQLYKDAKRLEEFFDAQLVKLLPEYAQWGDPPSKRARVD
ncbi:E3 ubiquitin-protein ligase TRIM33 [Aricia agestis]|uniref:E3 ubiquitin-protein ligase TRIM33 n=1 Tax=Aricia agestis TaxID=91739 RepID=UPI001C207C20|nr:E3 ubiquitin-protein ligase TRIM33 [Aricia agestis]